VGKLQYSGRLLREFVGYAREKKAYWIVPLVIVFAIVSLVVVASQTVAPVLYTLF
jgi:hypothetical protein